MRWVPFALLLAACGGKDDAGDTDGDIPGDTSGWLDTGGEEYSIDGAFWGVVGRFAFDGDNGLHVPYVEPGGGPAPIVIEVTLVDSSIQETGILDETTSCTVRLQYDGTLPIASWVDTHGAWTGFDLPPTAKVRDGCRNYFGLPQEIVGNVGPSVAQWAWGIGVGPELDPVIGMELEAALEPSEWAALKPSVVAGAIVSPVFAGATTATATDGFSDGGYAVGYEVDGNYEIVVGGTGVPIPLPADVVEAPEVGVATGYYEVVMGYWTNSAVLAGSAP